MKDKTKQIAYDLKKIKDSIEKFANKYSNSLTEELGIYAVIAVIKDRGIFIEKVKYDLNELSLNATNIEKQIITKKLTDKYKEKDKTDRKEQKKLITKQIKEIKKKENGGRKTKRTK